MGVATYIKDEKDAIKEVLLQSGIKVKAAYGPEDLERVGFDYRKDLGDPGEFPFTRSIHPLGPMGHPPRCAREHKSWPSIQNSISGEPTLMLCSLP